MSMHGKFGEDDQELDDSYLWNVGLKEDLFLLYIALIWTFFSFLLSVCVIVTKIFKVFK